jgi:hypothetical protein
MLFAHGRCAGTVCNLQTYTWTQEDNNGDNQGVDAKLYDFYHGVLKPKNITPGTFFHALHFDSHRQNSDFHQFARLLRGSRDKFQLDLKYEESGRNNLLLTEERRLGNSLHPTHDLVPVGAILVFLFGTEIPFILVPIPGTQSYQMVNIAYVPRCGDQILDSASLHSEKGIWIDFAAEGGKEYAIV